MGIETEEIIGGADGPTTIFLLDKSKEPTFRQRMQSRITRIKRYFIAKRIHPGTHSLEELGEYLVSRYGFVEADMSDPQVIEEYEQLRVSLLFEHRPDLVGEPCFPSIDDIEDTEAVLRMMDEATKKNQEKADSIAREVFDLDFHKYVKTEKNAENMMDVTIERNAGYIGDGASGSKSFIRKSNKIMKDAYLYYGVSEEDIRTNSQRYKDLLVQLSM
ncbi:hypothetical protein [Butyrivibrio sp. AE3004]|uniref:hypothetical protein n=1 Tax=Butyrivibrio sp. AE3004 TaxID=1506994 RepID=UPI0004945906|nr:hypothetical protein [Butyrivibrio sp. AE3004]